MPIYYESRKTLATQAAARWRNTYFVRNGEEWGNTKNGNTHPVYIKLLKLGKNPNPDDVDEVIGNESWTRLTCDNCNKEINEGVWIGEHLDYESRTTMACVKCLQEGINTITNKGENNE